MRALLRAAGTDVAAQCFLNALLRETKDWRYLPLPMRMRYLRSISRFPKPRRFGCQYAISHPPSIISTVSRQR